MRKRFDLDVDVYLRARVQLGHHGRLKRLLEVEAHLRGLAVSVRPPLPLRGAEGGHAVLTVDDGSVVEGSTAGASHLVEKKQPNIVVGGRVWIQLNALHRLLIQRPCLFPTLPEAAPLVCAYI